MSRHVRRYVLVATACVASLLSASGCVTASLATSTGPRTSGDWSVARRQRAHVGEEVQFDFVLHDPLHPFQEAPLSPLGIADYCVAIIGNERIETEPDMRGHFSFSHRFTDVRTGQTVLVEAAAYRLKGRRDYMRIAGQWVRGSSPYDKPDKRVAADSVRLQFYEAPIEIVLEPSGDDWLIEAGRLDIRRLDGTVSTVLPDRLDRRGFTMSGPDTAGRYRVKYVPSGTELNPTGSTQAVFIISDRSGKTHRLEETILTP